MNTLIKITIFILLFSSFVFSTADGPDNFDVRGVASNDVLWIHPTANYKSKKIGKIPYNATCVQNLGCRGRWCKIKYKGTVGWVNGKFLMEGGNCPQVTNSNHSQKKIYSSQYRFTSQMLEETTLQTRAYNSDLTLKFIPPRFKSFDGAIIFHFNSNAKDDNEILSYKLIEGKIIYYANDGSKYRLTLLSQNDKKWTMLEEEDIDGDGQQFGYANAVKKTYIVKSLNRKQKNPLPTLSTSTYGEIDKLMMQIYGRMDTRIASRRDHIQNINDFLYTASLLLIKKHKLDIQMQEYRRHQMAAVATPPKVTAVIHSLDDIEKLNGQTVVDHNGNKLTTMSQLKDTYSKAAKESMQMQRDNYISEKTRTSDLTKLETLLIQSGSLEQKNEMLKSETMRLKGEYKYYKKILDNASVWSLADRDVKQKKPLFYPKTFIIELLYDKYKLELIRSGKTYDRKDLLARVKKIEEKSKARKHQFNQDYLYDIRTSPDRLKERF